jgi:hypothetical protein
MLRLPAIPLVGGVPVVDPEMLQDRIREGDYLLIIAGDRLHTRVVQLSKSLLGRHLVRGWDLALVEVAVYVQANPQGIPEVLLVPYLRGAVIADERQVVKVIVSGDRARIDVEDASSVQIEYPRHNWNEAAAFAEFERADVSSAVRDFAHALRRLRTQYPSVSIDTGSGQFAKLILKRNGKSLLELSANGYIAFRPYKFPEALGTDLAITYQQALNELLGGQVKGTHPVIRLQPPTTDALVHGILQVIEKTVERANT